MDTNAATLSKRYNLFISLFHLLFVSHDPVSVTGWGLRTISLNPAALGPGEAERNPFDSLPPSAAGIHEVTPDISYPRASYQIKRYSKDKSLSLSFFSITWASMEFAASSGLMLTSPKLIFLSRNLSLISTCLALTPMGPA